MLRPVLLSIAISLLAQACSGVPYYYEKSYTSLLDPRADFLLPPPDEPEFAFVADMVTSEKKMLKDGFVMLGYSQQISPQYGGRIAQRNATSWGRKLGATKVLQLKPIERGNSNRYFLATYWAKAKNFIFGAFYDDLSASLEEKLGFQDGVLVKSVVDGSPAKKADIRQGDLILLFNDQIIEDTSTLDDLIKTHAGKEVTLSIWSLDNGETISVSVQLNPYRQ